jgi:hypothetical protein
MDVVRGAVEQLVDLPDVRVDLVHRGDVGEVRASLTFYAVAPFPDDLSAPDHGEQLAEDLRFRLLTFVREYVETNWSRHT